LGFGGAKFTKMGDTLHWTTMNRSAKFDAASFILGGEICNRTNKLTNKQTVNDILIYGQPDLWSVFLLSS